MPKHEQCDTFDDAGSPCTHRGDCPIVVMSINRPDATPFFITGDYRVQWVPIMPSTSHRAPETLTDDEWADARRRSIADGWAWETVPNDGEPSGLEYQGRPTFH